MAQHDKIYQHAVYYDIVFNRDVSRDINFMTRAYRRHTGRDLRSVLDIACGPGYHARAAARRGLRAVGLDLRPEMLEYARDHIGEGETGIQWVAGDMRDFKLDEPVDMALCMYDSIDALLTNADVVAHLRAVAANLTPKGLYLIECIHPRDCSIYNYGRHRHYGEQNGIAVEIILGANKPQFDPVTHVGRVEIEMNIRNNGDVYRIQDYAEERLYSPQEFHLLSEISGVLQVIDWYGDLDLDRPLDNSPFSQSMVGLFQKI